MYVDQWISWTHALPPLIHIWSYIVHRIASQIHNLDYLENIQWFSLEKSNSSHYRSATKDNVLCLKTNADILNIFSMTLFLVFLYWKCNCDFLWLSPEGTIQCCLGDKVQIKMKWRDWSHSADNVSIHRFTSLKDVTHYIFFDATFKVYLHLIGLLCNCIFTLSKQTQN